MKICQLVSPAWCDRTHAPEILLRLVVAVDDLKIQLQLGRELQAFRHFTEFDKLAGLAVQVGKTDTSKAV